MHCVYHSTLKAQVVDSETYDSLLKTGEWFDKPVEINLGDTNHENERQKNETANESRPPRLPRVQRELPGTWVDQSSDESGPNEDGSGRESENSGQVKRRGRPKKMT